MYDVLIIGAGPAGLTAAIYARRYGHSVLVFEKLIYGGQVSNTPDVENYPAISRITGADFATNLYTQVIFEEVQAVSLEGAEKTVITANGTYQGRTVIIANGAQRRTLGCPGEDTFSGRGVSYCATCDGAFYKDQDVAIVGGGNTALEDAFLSNLCTNVHILHRRDAFRGNPILVQALEKKPNIHIHFDTTVEEILGKEKLEGIKVRNTQTQKTEIIPVKGVFVAIGLAPENQLFADTLPLDRSGYLQADERCTTSIAGVFVAGDTRQKVLRQIVTATSDGAIAAFEASNYLNQQASVEQ